MWGGGGRVNDDGASDARRNNRRGNDQQEWSTTCGFDFGLTVMLRLKRPGIHEIPKHRPEKHEKKNTHAHDEIYMFKKSYKKNTRKGMKGKRNPRALSWSVKKENVLPYHMKNVIMSSLFDEQW